jgi:hypothetical protein
MQEVIMSVVISIGDAILAVGMIFADKVIEKFWTSKDHESSLLEDFSENNDYMIGTDFPVDHYIEK